MKFDFAFASALALACGLMSGCGDVTPPPTGGEPPPPPPPPEICESAFAHEISSGVSLEWVHRFVGFEHYTLAAPETSPAWLDLNADGCPDIVYGVSGVGFRRYQGAHGDFEIPLGIAVAVDGVSGKKLWDATSQGALFALPTAFKGADGRTRVVFGGRVGALFAVDAELGTRRWDFDVSQGEVDDYYLNFFNPIVLGDVNGDGADDLFVVYGGYDLADPGEARPASYFGVVSGETGEWLARRRTPDLAESYMSPVLLDGSAARAEDWTLLVGTGGESLPGDLWEITVSDVFAADDGETYGRRLAPGVDGKGVQAPPLVGELREAGATDIVAAFFGGQVVLLNASGATREKVWSVDFPGEEMMSVPAPVQIDASTMAVGIVSQVGVFPDYEELRFRILDLRDGAVLAEESIEGMFSNSPVSARMSSEDCDDVLVAGTDFRVTTLLRWKCADASFEQHQMEFGTMATPIIRPRKSGGADLLWMGSYELVGDEVPAPEEQFRLELISLPLSDTLFGAPTWLGYMGDGSSRFSR